MSPTVLVISGRPPTAYKPLTTRGALFLEALVEAHRKTGDQKQQGHLYGVIYWFVRGYDHERHADADNMSKKVWDKLKLHAYDDDKQVRLRIAGVRDLSPRSGKDGPGLEEVDLSNAPGPLLDALDGMLDGTDGRDDAFASGVVYIEVGPLSAEMFRFGLALSDASEGREEEKGRI